MVISEASPRHRRAKLGFVGLSAVVVPALLITPSIGEAGSPWAIRWAVLLLVASWWLSPLALYWTTAGTLPAVVAIGLGYPIGASSGIVAIYVSESSTAGIGILTIPMLLWGGVLAALIVERIVMSIASRRHA